MNKKLLTMGLAALLMAGCSSDDIVGGEGDKGGASAVKGYVGITIALPSTSASRAVEYEEGTPEEYAVNDVTLLFFNGNTLKQVTQFKAGDFTWAPAEDNGDGITTETVLPVVPLVDKNATNVLAIVNNNSSLLKVTSSTITESTGLIATGNEGSLKDKNDNAITDKATLLQAIEGTDVSAFTGNGYFMSSAAISTSADADKLFTVIEPKETKLEAIENADNTIIHVERIVGKATVQHAAAGWTNWTYKITTSTSAFYEDQIEFKNWALDLTNTKTYPFHKVSTEAGKDNGFDKWMEVSLFEGNQKRYMWAIDPNYSADLGTGELAPTAVANVDKDLGAPLYCLENTFDANHMTQPQTTRLLLKAQYTPSAAHVTGDDTKGSVTGLGWFRLGESTQAYTLNGIETELLAKAKVIHSEATAVTVSNLKVGKAAFSKAGDNQISVTGGTWNDDDLDKLINMAGKLTFFQEGFCYYPVLIKHFAQPWSGENYLIGAANDNDFLGRYGIVRNNWYEITINKVSAPGEPVYPTVPDLADDVTNYYIQATVKILDWAKRSQSVDL